MAGVVNTCATQTSMAAPVNCGRKAVNKGKRDAYTVSERGGRRGRLPESRDRLASRPLTPLMARNFQRAVAASCEPTRQWRGRATRFPVPLTPRHLSEIKTKVQRILKMCSKAN